MKAQVAVAHRVRVYDCRVEMVKNFGRVLGFIARRETNRIDDDFCERLFKALNEGGKQASFEVLDVHLVLRCSTVAGPGEQLCSADAGDLRQLDALIKDPAVMWHFVRMSSRHFGFRAIAVNRGE